MNKVLLIGNLSKDVELSTTASGVNVAKFTLAVKRKYTNESGEKETDFINCVAWRTLADTCHKYLHKGSKVAITGTIQNRSYNTQDGTKRYITEIICDEVDFLTPKNNNATEKVDEIDLQPIAVDDEDLPF